METKDKDEERLVRTSVLVRESTDQALRDLAEQGNRPLSYQIRIALERFVEEQRQAA